MDAALFILVTLIFGLVACITQLPPWITGLGSLTMLGAYVAWTLRRRDRELKPMRADFDRLFQQFASRYKDTKTGKRFLEMVSKPIPTKSKFDEGMDNLVSTGSNICDAVTDPGRLLLGLVLAPVMAGVGSLIGKVWKDERTEEQKRSEAVLLHARHTLDRSTKAYQHRIIASAVASVGIIVAYPLIVSPEYTPRVDSSESVATAPLVAAPISAASPAPVVETLPGLVVSTPAPEPTVIARQAPVAAPTLSPAFATVSEAQRAAVERYPALSIGGSKLNAAFVARYKLYKQTRPEYFTNSAWPMNLAVEVSHEVH